MNVAMERLDKAYNGYCQVKNSCMLVAGGALFASMFYITLDVIVRNFTPFALVGTYEIVQNYLMPLIGFPALAYAYSSGVMPRIVMLTDRFSSGYRKVLAILIPVMHLVFFGLMAYFSLQYALKSTVDKASFICGTKMLPIYPFYYLPVLGFVMMAVEDVFIIIKNCIKKEESVLYRQG